MKHHPAIPLILGGAIFYHIHLLWLSGFVCGMAYIMIYIKTKARA
jgi:hypothetical protein